MHHAAGGVDFAEHLVRGEFDLVIAERHLDWGDGLRVLDAVKSFYPDRPAVLLTRQPDPELVSQAVALDLDALLPKTAAGYARLPALVEELLERRAAGSRAEQARRRLTENLPVGVFSLSAAAGITRANPALAALLGCRDPAELWGEPLESFLADEEERRRLRTAVAAGEALPGSEVRLARRDGSGAWARLTAWPVGPRPPAAAARPDDAGEIHYDGTLEDISAYRRAGEELSRRAAALDRSNAELQGFADVVAHDLQAPLARIDRYARLLDQRAAEDLTEAGRGYLQQLTEAGVQMQQMLEAILDYARVSSRGREFEEVDLEAVLAEVIENLGGEVEASGGVVTHDPLPAVRADPAQMLRLLQNLVGNALKFRRGPAPKVHLSAGEEDGFWRLRVRDDGIGIPAAERQRVFKMFERLHGDSDYPGSGVGLTICKRIVERHGGTIAVEDSPGGGSTFVVTLPRDP